MTATASDELAQRAQLRSMPIARLLISCDDRRGIVAAVSRCLADAGANIIQSDQYSTDPEGGRFFMRLEFQIGAAGLDELPARFGEVAQRFGMEVRLSHSGERKRVALM